jgi:hypothetical protein
MCRQFRTMATPYTIIEVYTRNTNRERILYSPCTSGANRVGGRARTPVCRFAHDVTHRFLVYHSANGGIWASPNRRSVTGWHCFSGVAV